MVKDGLSLKMNNTYSSVLHSHTAFMKLCPCGIYRQLNSVLYPNNHLLKSSKVIFNGLVLHEFSTCRHFDVLFFLQNALS